MAEDTNVGEISLKKIEYTCDLSEDKNTQQKLYAVYTIIKAKDESDEKDICYFSGIDMASSTVVAISSIVKIISEQEKRDIHDLRFIDILTFRGVGLSRGYMIQELVILDDHECDEGLRTFWKPTECPDEIKKIFVDYAKPHK